MNTKVLRLLLLFTLLTASFGPSATVRAAAETPLQPGATFEVNSTNDWPDMKPGDGSCSARDGSCTLRAAVEEANANAAADTITLPAQTFYLNSQLAVTSPVVIKGAGREATFIDGSGATRVFRFAARSGPHYVYDLTIQNAVNQYTTDPERYGGGIFSQADLHLTNVTVKNSKAFEGGGIYNRYYFPGDEPSGAHTLWLNNVIISGNQSTSQEMYFGAGGLFNGSNLYADGLKISGNSAPVQGGGFLNNTDITRYPLTVDIRNFEISNNTSADGGGVDVDLGAVTFTNGKISGNTSNCCRPANPTQATGGGGIYSNFGVLTLTNVEISNNSATHPNGYGGGIYNAELMTLVNVSLTGNKAALGAAIHNGNYLGHANQLSLTNVTISGNQATLLAGTNTAEGGAIFSVQASKISIVNSTITQNTAQFTGGIENYSANGVIALKNTILTDNTDSAKAPDCSGTITSLGNNLIGDSNGNRAKTCSLTLQAGDKDNVFGVTNAKPATFSILNLPALDIQAGLTYFSLPSGSLAIDSGNNDGCPATDEIGTKRPFNQTCDIGAIEFGVAPTYQVSLSPTQAAKSGVPGSFPVTYNLTVTNNGNMADTFTVSVASQWTAGFPATIGPLNPGASAVLGVNIQVPADAQDGAASQASVTVVSQGSPNAQAVATLTTTANSSVGPIVIIYLPVILQ